MPTMPFIENNFSYVTPLNSENESLSNQYGIRYDNGICLVGLTKQNQVIKSSIKNLTFYPNIVNTNVQGKKKRGAKMIKRNTKICSIECEDNTIYDFVPGFNGLLVEINKRLTSEVTLINKKPEKEGWICILQLTEKENQRVAD
eukprot:gb/GECH01001929.1/.p1 GENE.gb/GECH01001929.1/~~gb/GECH01001929.1/.p1  ORF type:complete len:144 (+),score=23.20 gb/GECH01001929.1/:1-432(+)